MKNKELDKLYCSVMPYVNVEQYESIVGDFLVCEEAIEGEIAAIKAELTDAKLYKDIYHDSSDRLRTEVFKKGDELRKAYNQIDELKEKLNNERKHGEDLADANCQLASENVDLKAKVTLLETSRITWRSRAQHAEKAVTDLNKKVSDLEKELAETKQSAEIYHRSAHDMDKENDRLREVIDEKEKEINTLKKKVHELEKKNADDEIRIKSLERANSVLRRDNGILWSKMEEFDISKRPWHVDGNAMTDPRICYESLIEAIEFQNKKIEELEAEKVGKERKENVDLSYGHDFEFGDEVFVPWSDEPYMYVKSGMMYNPRTERLVYVGKDQHLKWFGEKFSIV